jgi:alanine dehydrogenase
VRVVPAEDVARALSYDALTDALADAFRGDIVVPERHHHTIAGPHAGATLLLMPAWTVTGERFLGCKTVTVFPDNATRGKPSVYGTYMLLSGETGEPLAVMDGRVLTAWRTAAASALAAKFLARPDASHLVMIGAGALAGHLVRAHAAVWPLRRITLWNRSQARAEQLANELRRDGFDVTLTQDLAEAVAEADVVSCATLAAEPLVRGVWLKQGTHVDLVGGFTPQMREADDETVRRAGIFVDTRAGALKEAGDIVDPIRRRVITRRQILGDLFDLCRGKVRGRRTASEITLFKSVGSAIEDLAAAVLVWRRLGS